MDQRTLDTRQSHQGELTEPPVPALVHLVQMHQNGHRATQGEEAEVPSSEVGQEVEPHPPTQEPSQEPSHISNLQGQSQGATPGTLMT